MLSYLPCNSYLEDNSDIKVSKRKLEYLYYGTCTCTNLTLPGLASNTWLSAPAASLLMGKRLSLSLVPRLTRAN